MTFDNQQLSERKSELEKTKPMIKFFRRIRQKFIDKGNVKKYLIYAIGEIVLIIIGIFFALQLQNWNEKRKQNAEFEIV